MAKKILRNPNSYGTIVNLGRNRRRPYVVKVEPILNERGWYDYKVLGYYENRTDAIIALAEYNKNPYDLDRRRMTFSDVYATYFRDRYENSRRTYSKSSVVNAKFAYGLSTRLHDMKFAELRHSDLQRMVDDCPLKHAL